MVAPPPAAPDARRFVLVRVAVLAAAVGIGLALQSALRTELAALQKLAETDVLAARATLATWLRVGGAALFSLTSAVGVSILVSSRRSVREQRFPPSGVWSWGAAHIVTGARAQRLAYVGIALGILLVICSAAAAALTWWIGATLLACRAV